MAKISQFHVRLPEDTKEGVMHYLYRTTLLWNAMVEHIEPYPAQYLDEPETDESNAMMGWVIMQLYQILVNQNFSLLPEFKLTPAWAEKLKAVRELGEAVCLYRIEDLKKSYRCAKHRVHLGDHSNSGLPTRKRFSSTQTIRFPASVCQLDTEIGQLTIQGVYAPLVVQCDGFKQLDPQQRYTVTITRGTIPKSVRHQFNGHSNMVFSFVFMAE